MAEPFADFFEKNFKIRSLNLRNNVINDEGAKLLLHAMVRNIKICKFNVDLNPINHKIINEIEKHTKENQLKVSEQEVSKMIKEVIEIKKDCSGPLRMCRGPHHRIQDLKCDAPKPPFEPQTCEFQRRQFTQTQYRACSQARAGKTSLKPLLLAPRYSDDNR